MRTGREHPHFGTSPYEETPTLPGAEAEIYCPLLLDADTWISPPKQRHWLIAPPMVPAAPQNKMHQLLPPTNPSPLPKPHQPISCAKPCPAPTRLVYNWEGALRGTQSYPDLGLSPGISPYLRKFSSVPGAKPGAAAGLSENTSTRRFPALVGAAEPAGGAARSPNKSADGDGVDCREHEGWGEFIPLGHNARLGGEVSQVGGDPVCLVMGMHGSGGTRERYPGSL